MINKFIGNGRVTKDIELKCTPSGSSVVSFTLAITRNFKIQNGEYDSDFINCIAYRETAELLSRYVKKGDTIGVDGSVRTRNYINNDNNKVYVTEIVVDSIDFLKQANRQDNITTSEQKEDKSVLYPDAIEITDDDLPF